MQGKIGLHRDIVHEYSCLDPILYHLGVGVTLNDTPSEEGKGHALEFLNEYDPNFRVMPLFGTVPAQLGIGEILRDELKIDFSKVNHGPKRRPCPVS